MNPDLDTRSKLESLPEGSHVGDRNLDVGIAPAPPVAKAMLPERYGVPQFEFLLVDPEYVFIIWEITLEQLDAFRKEHGEAAFAKRALQVRILDTEQDEAVVQECELYGEQGRWFIGLTRCGYWAKAQLGFAHPAGFTTLLSAGPLALPRTVPVECTTYEELRVDYGIGESGESVIAGLRHDESKDIPKLSLPGPQADELTLRLGQTYPSSPGKGW